MLYRDSTTPVHESFLLRLRRVFATLAPGRQRRHTDLDLARMSPRLRADIGLDDLTLIRR